MNNESIPNNLTELQYTVLELLSQGFSNKQISQNMGKSLKATESALHQVMVKLGLSRSKEERDRHNSACIRVKAAVRFVTYQLLKDTKDGATLQE